MIVRDITRPSWLAVDARARTEAGSRTQNYFRLLDCLRLLLDSGSDQVSLGLQVPDGLGLDWVSCGLAADQDPYLTDRCSLRGLAASHP